VSQAPNGTCDCCGFPGPVGGLRLHPAERPADQSYRLCRLCDQTMTGLLSLAPRKDFQVDVLRTVCYVGNTVLRAIADGQMPRQP
jgi:hypothetical protein